MPDSPRDEREFNAGIEVHTPQWLPGGKGVISFRRTWDHRASQFAEKVQEGSGVSSAELESRLAKGDQLYDIFATSIHRASQSGDANYRDALALLVIAALLDDARVDEVSYIVDRLVRLEPIHVRALFSLHELIEDNRASPKAKESSKRNVHKDDNAASGVWIGRGRRVSVATAADLVDISVGVFESCLHELAESNFVRVAGGYYRPGDATRSADVAPTRWTVTKLGIGAASEVRRVRDLLDTRRSDPGLSGV